MKQIKIVLLILLGAIAMPLLVNAASELYRSLTVSTTLSVGTDLTIQNQGDIRFSEQTGNGSNYIGFQAPDAVTTNLVFKLPDGDGATGQALKTDGSGNLDWVTLSGESNTASNSGGGLGLAQTKSGVDLPFKSLTAGENITLTSNTDDVEIAVTSPAFSANITSTGGITSQTGTWITSVTDNPGAGDLALVLTGFTNTVTCTMTSLSEDRCPTINAASASAVRVITKRCSDTSLSDAGFHITCIEER